MKCNMSGSYNLRSVKRKKPISVRNSFTEFLSENRSSQALNPTVCLERLKLLECHDIQNSRFYLKKGRLTVKENKSILSKKYLLRLFCTVILCIIPVLYWRGYSQINGIELVKKYEEIHSSFQNYYSEVVQFFPTIWKQFEHNRQKSERQDGKSTFGAQNMNSTLMNDNFEIRQLVRDYLIEIKKKNKIQNSNLSPHSFIEEQCKRDIKDNLYSGKKKFHNATFNDLTNLIDYALESQGAEIVTVFNTELYGVITVKYLNINLWPGLSQLLRKNLKYFGLNGPSSILVVGILGKTLNINKSDINIMNPFYSAVDEGKTQNNLQFVKTQDIIFKQDLVFCFIKLPPMILIWSIFFKPWKKLGDCWAFKGSHGRVQIKLSDEIIVTAITVEHIPKEITTEENMQSAPNKFSLIGIEEFGNNSKKTYLGSYQYDISGPAAQTFLIEPKVEIPFGSVEVAIESNHGNEKYTCIYKVRIHGHK